MRDAFLKALTELAENDKEIMLLTGDLGFGVFEDFEERFPNQYYNVGVAEQNMTGVATGLALEGKKVFTYSIGNFPTLRCLEQIRNDAAYHDANVTIVASGGGFSYGSLGMSHHCTEDLSILRSLPNLTVIAPSTPWESEQATQAMVDNKGVGYLRLDKTAVDDRDGKIGGEFAIGKARKLRDGQDLALICTGGITNEALKAAEMANEKGLECSVFSFHTIKPIDQDTILEIVSRIGKIVTIEEHNIVGGLGSAVAEVIIDNGVSPSYFKRIGLMDTYSSVVGSQDYLRQHYKMDATAIFNTIMEA